jgi:hypothetical protein
LDAVSLTSARLRFLPLIRMGVGPMSYRMVDAGSRNWRRRIEGD